MTAGSKQHPTAIRRPARSALVVLLALAVVLLSPGLPAYQACAAVVEDGAPELPTGTPAPVPVVPAIPSLGTPVSGLDAPALPSVPEVSGLQATQPAAASAQAQVPELPAAAAEASAPAAQAQAAAEPAAVAPAAAPAKQSPLSALRSVVSKLAGVGQNGAAGVISGLYGEKSGQAGETAVAGQSPDGEQPSGLTTLSASDLEAVASDSKKASDERLSAVKALARRGGAEAMAALERVGAYDANATAADYELKRQSLRALAGLGKVVSLPAVSPAHAQAILSQLRSQKVEFAAFDFDKTLEDGNGAKISRETAEAVTDLARSGVETMINTDRAADSRGSGDVGIFDTLSPLQASERPWITVGSNRGAKVWTLDASGQRHLVSAQPGWTSGERASLIEAGRRVGAKYAFSREQMITEYDSALFLAPELSAAGVEAASELFQTTLGELGLPTRVMVHQPRVAGQGSYLTLSKYDKSLGISQLRRLRQRLGRLRAVERWLPAPLRGLGRRLVSLLPSPVAPSNGLLVGDHFFGPKMIDADMMKGAPNGLGISVGGTADPRLDNVFVWPTKGHGASMDLVRAAAVGARAGERAPGPDDAINNKTLVALITQRLPSMAAYMLVTIAFVNVAVPIVGWAGYGILMSLSPMAGIAAAKIMAGAIKNMDARKAMSVNTILRVFSLGALPFFHFFGILNVGTLLLGALAEGFLLSSIMTTEGSFLKVLFPAKQLGNINGALFMMFPGVQVILGLFLHFGKVADLLSPFTIFAGAAMVNLVMVLPIILWGIPRIKLSANGAPAPAQPKRSLRDALKASWKQAALFVAGTALFAGLTFGMPSLASLGAHVGWAWPGAIAAFIKSHQGLTAPIGILGALIYWIVKSDAFAAIKSGSTAQAGKAEQALRDERAAAQARGASAQELAGLDAQLKPYEGRQMRSIWLMAASTLLYYPLYLVAAPNVAEILVGTANKGQMMGQFLGALFFGGLLSTAARTKLPEIGLTIAGKRRTIGAHRLVQAATVLMAGAWAAMLAPGILTFLGGAAAAAGIIAISGRITDRGWIQLLGVGAAAIWLPFIVWSWPTLLPFLTIKTAMYAALLAIGLVNGPSFVSLISYMQRNTLPADASRAQGIQGALFNAAISAGYALLTIVAGFINPAYPAVLALLGLISAALGVAFWRAPKGLPGLSSRLLEPRRKAPQTTTGGKS